VVGRQTQIDRALVIGQTFPEIAASRLATGVADGFWDYSVDLPDNLVRAVSEISRGGGYMSYGLGELRRRSLQGRPSLRTILSRTEILVFYAIAGGEDDFAAGALLGMTPATVKTHRKSISRKLKVSTRTELMREAQLRGIVRFVENGLVIRPGFFAAMDEYLGRRQARPKSDETVGAS
jgi:DNA-binding NarL/FixJ family response regulator